MAMHICRRVRISVLSQRSSGLSSIALCCALLAACVDSREPIGPPAMSQDATVEGIVAELQKAFAQQDRNHDVLFSAVAELEPWFGGLYIDGSEIRTVSTDSTINRARAIAVAEGVLRAAGRTGLATRAPDVRIVHGRFAFSDLATWRDQLRPALPTYGVHGVRLAEDLNRVVLELESPAAATAITDLATSLDVPLEAILVRITERARFTHHIGGHSANIWRDGDPVAYSQCTLTQAVTHMLPSVFPDSLQFGITTSHCTAQWGTTGSDVIVSGSTPIADAVWDHPMITDSRCVALTGTTTAMCRYSDAALFQYRTSFVSSLDKHKVLTNDSLHSEIAFLFVGDTVQMYGRTSGLISGTITSTCADHINTLPAHMSGQIGQLCQYGSTYAAQLGDSGGPVWFIDNLSSPARRLFAGIQSYKISTTSYFSGVNNIANEINPNTTGWGSICLSYPAVSPGSWTCPW